ncbi:hypothetical protein EJC49_15535 [Aquibium carbonis]|jgi:hypothetical protein|uniref:Uncharacterized protein n=1 Tax=Aquibium carbonis TaxID=2495581 RepID=A0A429YVL2_9HYPH|nr:hypothetical protein [Aquibium carbonis]RST85498.1 hypothetical protein EJC49_15535 [Aquibium carbonis]
MSDIEPDNFISDAEERPVEISEDGEIVEFVSGDRHHGYRVTGPDNRVRWAKTLGEARIVLGELNGGDAD